MLWIDTRSIVNRHCPLGIPTDQCLQLNLLMLRHPSTSEMLTAVIETTHRYFIIWTSMNAVSMITHALYSAHQEARVKGIQSRALLMLLEELDAGRYLDSPSREHVAADFAALAHVSRMVVPSTKFYLPNAPNRRYIPSRTHQTVYPMYYPKYFFLPKITILTLQPFLPIVYGISTEHH